MARLIDVVVVGAGVLLAGYSIASRDWQTAGMAAVVVLGTVGYRRGRIRRFGR